MRLEHLMLQQKFFVCVDWVLGQDGTILHLKRSVQPFKGFLGLVGWMDVDLSGLRSWSPSPKEQATQRIGLLQKWRPFGAQRSHDHWARHHNPVLLAWPDLPEHHKPKNLLTSLSPENSVAINPTTLHEPFYTLVFGQNGSLKKQQEG